MFTTSINMRPETYCVISHAACALKVPRREIIVRLLMRVMRDIALYRKGFSTVRYQADDRIVAWHCFSIQFNPDENEFFSDLRKFCKCSVSLLVALAVEKYIDDLIGEKGKDLCNYMAFSNYSMSHEVNKGIHIWKIHIEMRKPPGKPVRE